MSSVLAIAHKLAKVLVVLCGDKSKCYFQGSALPVLPCCFAHQLKLTHNNLREMVLNESNIVDIYRKLISNDKIDPKEREKVINRFYELAFYEPSQTNIDEPEDIKKK